MDGDTSPSSDNAWDELDIADTQYEQAEEATIRMARLCRVFYVALTENNGVPPQIAAPLIGAYVQNLMALGNRGRRNKE